MPQTPNAQPKANLIAKLLTSAALVLASGAYMFLQQGGPASAIEAGNTASPHAIARAEPPGSMPAPVAPPTAAPSQPGPAQNQAAEPPLDKFDLPRTDTAPERARGETESPAPAAPSQEASIAPPAAPVAEAPPANDIIAAAPPPRAGLADGDYTGDPANCQWGTVQVAIRVQGGAVAQVNFLQVPDHRRRSAEISDYVVPVLAQEAIKAQNNNVDLISGATATSYAFQQALSSALRKAKT